MDDMNGYVRECVGFFEEGFEYNTCNLQIALTSHGCFKVNLIVVFKWSFSEFGVSTYHQCISSSVRIVLGLYCVIHVYNDFLYYFLPPGSLHCIVGCLCLKRQTKCHEALIYSSN